MVDLGEQGPSNRITASVEIIGPDGSQTEESCVGRADAVAAWMRAVASRLDPVKSVSHFQKPTYRQGGPI